MNQIKEEEKNEAVDKKKSLALKMSSHQKETSESFYNDEKDEMAIVAKRYKKLVLQKGQRMGRKNFKNIQFKGGSSRGNEVICYECKMLGLLKNECLLNKKIKKYKMKKKILVETWSDCESSSFSDQSMIEPRANFCFMAKDDKVCNIDDLDIL